MTAITVNVNSSCYIGIALLIVATILIAGFVVLNHQEERQKVFYVGVTYCGSSVQEAKELVDQVKDYTNLFVLQSATIRNAADVNEIGDYAVASNLSFAVYNSVTIHFYTENDGEEGASGGGGNANNGKAINQWANAAKQRWGEQFIGIYYNDEIGGDMLDKASTLESPFYQQTEAVNGTYRFIQKTIDGAITIFDYTRRAEGIFSTALKYYHTGRIIVEEIHTDEVYMRDFEGYMQEFNSPIEPNSNLDRAFVPDKYISRILTDYHANGIITVREFKLENNFVTFNFYTTENITKYPSPIQPYEQILEQNPIRNYDDAAKAFVNINKDLLDSIDKKQLNRESILVFTADYGLYWWDYQSGYDVILAELAWNNTVAQEIGLVRGAANFYGKSWGTCITWKYTQPPYLTDGEEMFEQMKLSYEAGAEYVLIFNYSEDPANPDTLHEEHYLALERFWKDIVQNPDITQGNIKAEAVLILPKNYGWGMRNPQDTIWGLWPTDNKSEEIWNQLQNKIDQYGLKIDITFEKPNYFAIGKYPNTYYWNQKQ